MEHDASDAPDWGARLTAVIGAEIARHRRHRGLTAQALADECKRIGHPIARSTIAKLEASRTKPGRLRPYITAAELVVIARALRVPPLLLLAPVGGAAEVEIAPSLTVPASTAARWVAGMESSTTGYGSSATRDPMVELAHESLRHDVRASELRRLCRRIDSTEIADPMDYRMAAERWAALRRCRERIVELSGDGAVAPALPPDLAWVDAHNPPGGLGVAGGLRVSGELPAGFGPGEAPAWERPWRADEEAPDA